LGSDGNDPTRSTYYPTLNTDVSTGVLIATKDAIGNVLTNDIAFASLSPIVTKIASDTTGLNTNVSTLVSGTTQGSVKGQFGTLTITSSGAYTYVIDNANTTVNALLPSDAPLTDTFTYTVIGKDGSSATAKLNVKILGSDDAPIAYHDTNTAKEQTTSVPSDVTFAGIKATGNVLNNDTDVDKNDSLSLNFGVSDFSATLNVSSMTLTAPSSVLTFEGNLSSASIDSGKYVGVTVNGVFYKIYNGSGSTTQVKILSKGTGVDTDGDGILEYPITLDSTTLYYGTSSGTTALVIAADQTYGFDQNANFNSPDYATTMKAETAGKETINLSGAGYTTSNIVVGMSVSGTGWPTGSYVSKVSADSSGNITSIEVTVTSNVSRSLTSIATSFSLDNKSYTGKYGTLTLNVDGTYTYSPYTDIAKYYATGNTVGLYKSYTGDPFDAGASDTDTFTYTVIDSYGQASKANLTITVYGEGASDPVTTKGATSIDESGYASDGTTRGSTNPVTGSVTITGTYTGIQLSTSTTFSGSTTGNTSATNVQVTSSYGTLTIKGDGTYSYQLDNTVTAVNALQLGQTLTDTFYYKTINSTSGSTVNTITITINGSNDAPIVYDNQNSLTEDSGFAAQGNVLLDQGADNDFGGTAGQAVDTDVDNGDSFTVTNISNAAASTTSAVTTVNSVTLAGAYGFLTIGSNGAYSYRHYVSGEGHDAAAATIQNLTVGGTLTDTFTYQATDTKSKVSNAASLVLTINGANEPPVNTYPSSVTTSGGAYSFTTGLSIADPDHNAKTVVLHVDNGTISINQTGLTGVTVTYTDGGKTATLVLNDTDANNTSSNVGEDTLNAYLAKLTYTAATPPAGSIYTGDYLTIYTRDTNGGYDSDGLPIIIPSVATVSESGLSHGTNVAGTGTQESANNETFTVQLDVPLGKKVTDVSTTTTTYGTYSITNGVLTYTLNKTSSGLGTTDSFNYTVTDLDGNNGVVTPMTINITDDAPIARPDTNSALTGGSAIAGNILTDSTADSFGADGPKSGGGLIGCRAAGIDNATPVLSGGINAVGAPTPTTITGVYGTLTMYADGSYSYTPGSTAGSDVFVYTIEDADGSRSTTTLTITVSGSLYADLAMDKAVDTNTPALNGYVVYTLKVSNLGNSAAANVVISDTFDLTKLEYAGASLSSSADKAVNGDWNTSLANSTFNTSTGAWTYTAPSNLASGADLTVYVRAKVIGTTAYTNVSSVASSTPDPDSGNNTDDGNTHNYGSHNQTVTAQLDDDRPKSNPVPAIEPPPTVDPQALPKELPEIVAPKDTFSSELTPLAPTLKPVDPPPPLGAVLTSYNGHPIAVSESAPNGLSLYSGITDQFVQSRDSSVKISIPYDAFVHTNKEAVIKLQAKQADDSPLPNWVEFDPAAGTFTVKPPKDFKGKLDLKVIARDDEGREAVALFQMFVGEQDPVETKPQSRSSFTEKLRMAGKRPVSLVRVAEGAHKVRAG